MGKKRSSQQSLATESIKVEVKDEIGDNDVIVARDRLKGALRELLHHSDSESSESTGDEYVPETKSSKRSTPSYRDPTYHSKPANAQIQRKIRRRRQIQMDTVFHHTYVMKLFDRSVDLAQFREDTPLYPICRAWMANQPRNPNLVPKVQNPSPETVAENIVTPETLIDEEGNIREVENLPRPLPSEDDLHRNRIPSPIQRVQEELDLDYEGQTLSSKESLLKEHRAHWAAVRRKWHQQAHKNEQRFAQSASILSTIFKRAQSEFE